MAPFVFPYDVSFCKYNHQVQNLKYGPEVFNLFFERSKSYFSNASTVFLKYYLGSEKKYFYSKLFKYSESAPE